MTSEKLLRELAWRSGNLAKLFADPQPGLGSWALMVKENMEFLVNWWEGKIQEQVK